MDTDMDTDRYDRSVCANSSGNHHGCMYYCLHDTPAGISVHIFKMRGYGLLV